ncbi:MAG: hypothetical protein LBJ83_02440 [Oscillospiraceae bacterium]|nr:hypothetical protein [Oscillospiraceae bacterium]
MTVIDSATAIFSEWDISREVCGSFTTEFFVTGDVNQFVNGGLKLCDLDFGDVRQVSLKLEYGYKIERWSKSSG